MEKGPRKAREGKQEDCNMKETASSDFLIKKSYSSTMHNKLLAPEMQSTELHQYQDQMDRSPKSKWPNRANSQIRPPREIYPNLDFLSKKEQPKQLLHPATSIENVRAQCKTQLATEISEAKLADCQTQTEQMNRNLFFQYDQMLLISFVIFCTTGGFAMPSQRDKDKARKEKH